MEKRSDPFRILKLILYIIVVIASWTGLFSAIFGRTEADGWTIAIVAVIAILSPVAVIKTLQGYSWDW
jgi:hypothetical protein